MILDSKGNRNYKLGEGIDERQQSMSGSVTLGSEYDRTFRALNLHHQKATEEAGGVQRGGHLAHPVACIIQGIWLLWCYCSADFRRILSRLEAAEARIKELEGSLVASPTEGEPDILVGPGDTIEYQGIDAVVIRRGSSGKIEHHKITEVRLRGVEEDGDADRD